jgi:hypothetical protein
MTPPDDDIDLLRQAIDEKVAELEIARISLQEFNFPNETMRKAFARITNNTGFEVYKLRMRLKALLPPSLPSPERPILPDPAAMGTPLSPPRGSSNTTAPFGSPPTPPGLSALVTTLWHKDFCFSSDRSDLDMILRQAQEPISFDIDPEDPELLDPCLHVDSQLLVTLDPVTRTEVLRLAHELRSADIMLAQAKIKHELMESDAYIAKIVRVKSKLKPPAEFSKDPLFTTLSSEFTALVRKYQQDGTDIIRRLVNRQVTVYRLRIFPQVIHGLFRLAKQAVVGRRPQNDILDLLQMAHRETNLPELPETNEQVAGYAILLLLSSSTGHVLSHYIGLPDKTGITLIFEKTLALIRDCPLPRRHAEAQITPQATLVPHQATPMGSVDTSAFQTAKSLLNSVLNSKNPTPPKPNDDDSTLKMAAQIGAPQDTTDADASSYFLESPPDTHRTCATTVLIGNELFPLPSPACWALAMEIHQVLKPIANHITMVQRLQLARQLTRSKVITATKGLQINRDTFTATTSVRELIDRLDVEPHAVISIINGWHRATFRSMEQRLQKRLLQLTPNSKSKISPVAEIVQDTTPPRQHPKRTPPPSVDDRKRPAESTASNSERTPLTGKRAKNASDGDQPTASLPSSAPHQQQSQQHDDASSSQKKRQKKPRGSLKQPPKQPSTPRQQHPTVTFSVPDNATESASKKAANKRRNQQRQKQRQKRQLAQKAKSSTAAAANDASADA